MNLLYGRIVGVFPEDGMLAGEIRVGGAIKKVSLDLLVEPRIGDCVLVCDGVAISKVEDQKTAENAAWACGSPARVADPRPVRTPFDARAPRHHVVERPSKRFSGAGARRREAMEAGLQSA